MLDYLILILTAIAGYLLGSFPTGVIAARIFGWPDPRSHGSGHTGGLNAYRGGGLPALIVVGLVDFLKGLAAVWLAGQLTDTPWALPLAGIAAVAGHNWPVWLGFKGGMGLATAAGAALLQIPLAVLITGLLWLALKLIVKHSPRSTIAACATVPVTLLLLGADAPRFALLTGMAALIILRTMPDWNRVYPARTAAIEEESA